MTIHLQKEIEHLKKMASRGEQAIMALEMLLFIILMMGVVGAIFWWTKKKKRLADEENTPLRSEKSK